MKNTQNSQSFSTNISTMIPQENSRKYFAIVVHFGESNQTQSLVHTLLSNAHYVSLVLVVDHADEKLSLEDNARLHIIRPEKNRGYGAGINVGLGVLTSRGVKPDDIIVCMNNDINLTSKTMDAIVEWWKHNPMPALVGSKVCWVNLITGRTYISQHYPGPRIPTSPRGFAGRGKSGVTHRAYVHGEFFAAPYSVFMKTKGYPDHFFLYWEDVLFSWKVQAMGVRLYALQGLGVYHDNERWHMSEDQLYYLVRNGAIILERHTAAPYSVYWTILNRLRYVYHSYISGKRVVRDALRDATRHAQGKRKVQQ